MTLVDSLRDRVRPPAAPVGSGWWSAPAAGALAAAGSWLLRARPAVVR